MLSFLSPPHPLLFKMGYQEITTFDDLKKLISGDKLVSKLYAKKTTNETFVGGRGTHSL